MAFFIFSKCFTWHLPINSFHQVIVIVLKNKCESRGYAPPLNLLKPPSPLPSWPWQQIPGEMCSPSPVTLPADYLTVGRYLVSPFTPFTPAIFSPSGCLQALTSWLFTRLKQGLVPLLALAFLGSVWLGLTTLSALIFSCSSGLLHGHSVPLAPSTFTGNGGHAGPGP